MNVNEAFKTRQREALELIEQLKTRVSKLDGDFDNVDWTHVGSMHHTATEVTLLLEFLGK